MKADLTRRILAVIVSVLCLTGAPVMAEQRGGVVLSVTGMGAALEFSLEDLRAIGTESVATTTIWTEGVQVFTGTPLADFVDRLGIRSGTLNAFAANDYVVEIPLSDAVENGPIIAFERNGARMSLRENGPLWLIYPYDSNVAYQSEVIYARSIWQLERIDVVP